MKKNRFDLENEIMDCWKVTDEINMVTKHFVDSPKWTDMSGELSDAMMNKYLAISELYELKFQNLFDTFVDCIPDLKDFIEDNLEVSPIPLASSWMKNFSDDDGLGPPWDVEAPSPQIELRLNDVPPEGWDDPSTWDKATRG